MAYVYAGNQDEEEKDLYRGGAAGVQADYGLRDYFASRAADALNNGITQAQLNAAKTQLDPARGAYAYLMNNGLYSPAEMGAIESARVQDINNTTNAMQRNLNATLASRGQGGNAGMNAALSMSGQFAGAGQRAQVRADLIQKNKQAQLTGLEGFGNLSKAYADLEQKQINDGTEAGQYMDLYNQWRNSEVGYDKSPLALDNNKKDKKKREFGFGYSYGG